MLGMMHMYIALTYAGLLSDPPCFVSSPKRSEFVALFFMFWPVYLFLFTVNSVFFCRLRYLIRFLYIER